MPCRKFLNNKHLEFTIKVLSRKSQKNIRNQYLVDMTEDELIYTASYLEIISEHHMFLVGIYDE